MSESDLIAESLGRLLAERRAVRVGHVGVQEEPFDQALWDALVEGGFPWVSVPEAAGGVGGTVRDACAVLRTVARHGVQAPIAETGLLGGWLLAEAGMKIPDGIVTVSVGAPADRIEVRSAGSGWVVDAELHRVPWARRASDVLAIAETPDGRLIVRLPTDRAVIEPGQNLAGEDRSNVRVAGVELGDDAVVAAPDGVDADALRIRGALARVNAMAGAMAAASELTLGYSREREQFGRPISQFQAVQHQLVRMASEAAAAEMAALLAIAGFENGDAAFTVAAAKVVVCSAAEVVSKSAHQVHGAIGVTQEYELHRFTRPLWAWRQEFGSENEWATRLGAATIAEGPDALWSRITRGAVSA